MKQFIHFNVADRKLFEEYLNHMSEKGYSFKEMDDLSITFKECDRRKYYYVDLYEKIPHHHIDYKKEERQKQIDLYEEMGLNFKHVFRHFMIYESDKKVDLHSDLEVEEKLIKETQHRIFGGEYSAKQYLICSLLLLFSFVVISIGEKLSYLWMIPLTIIFLASIIFVHRKLKVIESKSEKNFEDAKYQSISQILGITLMFVSTSITFLISSDSIIEGLITYVKLFGATLTLFVVNFVFGKYDSNYEGKRTITLVICLIIFLGIVYFL